MNKSVKSVIWLAIGLLGAWAYLVLATRRGEPVNSAYLLIAALCSYAIGFRFYSKWIAARVLALNDRRATPCEIHDDGKDFVKTNKWIVFGHHFAAISGPGPLVGPVLAAQFGYLPSALRILMVVVLGGRAGQYVYGDGDLASLCSVKDITLAWAIIFDGFAASVLPIWLLLAPRDYLGTFMKLGTIFALALGVFLVWPALKFPAVSRFIDGSGPVVPGKLFPFCFITIACGAISGFHALISSGTTPKIITRESYARPIGYGAMCLESLVGIMALIAACTLDPGVYLSMNVKGAGATPP